MSESDALKALGAFPIVQGAVAVLLVLAGIYLMRRGERDRSEAPPEAHPQSYPSWLLSGPVHDTMRSVQGQAEHNRVIIHVLERNEAWLKEIVKEQREINQLLEMIRNESRLR